MGIRRLVALALVLCLVLSGCSLLSGFHDTISGWFPDPAPSFDVPDQAPEFDGKTPYVYLTGNKPAFAPETLTAQPFAEYGELDELGRCTVCEACLGRELMPSAARGDISGVYPSGWQQAHYEMIQGGVLYNRCHLIAYQLTGEAANRRNLITGTRFLNISAMLPFEEEVSDYIRETGNHVRYRVRPDFHEGELVARGVELEALSIEDGGLGVCFHVYCYNAQPGVFIHYGTGASALLDDSVEGTYILNTHTMKFHLPGCDGAASISDRNFRQYTGSRLDLVEAGYSPCGGCKP